MAIDDMKTPEYELGFQHGREYEQRQRQRKDRGINPVLYKIGAEQRRFYEDLGRWPTRVYLGTAEIHQIQEELTWSDIYHRRLSLPQTVMGLEIFCVKDQFHLRVV